MENLLKSFGEAATGLARNPLGIIALFIVLVYGFAALVAGASSRLQSSERKPIVWFLVLFPCIVLLVFAWLVSRHHEKLYSPSDFRNDDSFWTQLSREEQIAKLERQADQAAAPHGDSEVVSSSVKLKQEITLAKTLVFSDLEQKYSSPMVKEIEITQKGIKQQFDGAIIKGGDPIVVIDVKYIPIYIPDDNIKKSMATLARGSSVTNFKRILALVLDKVTKEEFDEEKVRIRKIAESLPEDEYGKFGTDWDLRQYGFIDLKSSFGITNR